MSQKKKENNKRNDVNEQTLKHQNFSFFMSHIDR
jgi:hypothetical protein